MKYAIILPDGAADEPVRALGGKTPLQIAKTPNMDRVARDGMVGRVVTVPKGFQPASDVATLSLLGYDPAEFYSGRAPLEAVAMGVAATPDQTIFRCNFVTIEEGRMRDFTAGHIASEEAERLIGDLNDLMSPQGVRFHSGVSYRNLLVAPRPGGSPDDVEPGGGQLKATPPHDIPDALVVDHLPRGEGSYAVRSIMQTAHDFLARHAVNRERAARGERVATDIWLWGQGPIRPLPSFAKRWGRSGVAIAAVDIVRGIAKSAGLRILEVPGATGYLDTHYAGKGTAAVAALDSADVVVIHVEAPDEAGHLGDAGAKIDSIEKIDSHVVGPVLEALRRTGGFRVLIAPDHPTPVEKRVHTSAPPPFCLAGTGIEPDGVAAFDEAAARASGLLVDPGYRLLDRLFRP